MTRFALALALAAATADPLRAQQAASPPAAPAAAAAPMKQWIYVIRPVPRLYADSAWTPSDAEAARAHYGYLQQLTRTGTVLMAGRTIQQPLDARTMGLVVFQAASADEARRIAEADPAVKAGVFTMEWFPFSVVLERVPIGK